MMRAIMQERYGTDATDVLTLEETGTPAIQDDEVLVRVHAAGVDRGTWHLMAGLPYLVRLGIGFRGPRQKVPGLDVAGAVAAVGADVTRFRVGDEVFGIARGSFAEYAAAKADKLVLRPDRLSVEQAGVVAVSGLTALQGLRDAGHVKTGQKVLVIGASGGVGTFAVQIAKAFGAEVTGVSSTSKTDLVTALGADRVIDYTTEDFADGRQRYDLILDTGGNTALARLRRALTPRGTLVIVGGEGGKWTGIGRQLRALALSPFVSQRLTFFLSKQRQADLDTLTQLIAAGQVSPVVDRTYALSEAPKALSDLAAGHARGKLAISI